MSASASKKKRKELAEQGLDAQSANAKKLSEKKKNTTKTVVIFALVVVVAIAGIFALLKYLEARRYKPDYDVSKPVATVGEEKISVPVYNLFYSMFANNFATNYGQFGVIQSGVPFSQQNFSDSKTIEQYLIESTNSSLQDIYNIAALAKEAGYTLSEEDQETVKTALANIRAEANNYGYDNVDHYLAARMGNGTDMDAYEEFVNVYQLYTSYSQKLLDDYAPSAEELDAAYQEDPNSYDTVSFRYLRVETEGETNAETGETSYSDEAKAAAKQKAEETAKDLPDDAVSVSYNYTSAAGLGDEIAEWLFDSARKEGDSKVFDGNETGSYYYAVQFGSRDDNKYARANAYVVAIAKDTDVVPEGQKSAQEKIDAIKAGLSEGMTEEAFTALITENGSSASANYVNRHAYTEEVISYLYDSARKEGDTTVIETEKTYYVIRYVKAEDGTYRDSMITSALFDKMYGELCEKNSIEIDEDMLEHANTDLTYNNSSAVG